MEKFANYFTYHLLLASYFGVHSVAPGNLTLLSSLHENFTFPFNLPEILACVTLVTFFLDLEGTTLFGVLQRASMMPDLVEKKAMFSLLFGKNPRSKLLTVLLKVLVVNQKEKKDVSRSFRRESLVELFPICLGEVAFASLTYRDLILSFSQVIS